MGLLIAFLISFFSFHGDTTYERFDGEYLKHQKPSKSLVESSGRPATGGVSGPIIVIEDVHLKPGKQN